MQDLEEFIDNLPSDEKIILIRLRDLILRTEPRITEKLSYGVPYYSRNRRLFFLWPASAIPSGHKAKTDSPQVTLGFCYGNLLSDDQGLLVKDGRKQVYTIPFTSPRSIDERKLSEMLNEAVFVDEQFFGKKKR